MAENTKRKGFFFKWYGKLTTGVLCALVGFYVGVINMLDDSLLPLIVVVCLFLLSLVLIFAGLLDLFRRIFKLD